jgi:hypothetical protein
MTMISRQIAKAVLFVIALADRVNTCRRFGQ